MLTIDLTAGQTIRIGRDIRVRIVAEDDGRIDVEIETGSPMEVLPGEIVGLELHQLAVLAGHDL